MNGAISPYGSWKSPITSALLTSSGIGLSELQFSDGYLYWLESRPDEAGRVVIVRALPEGKPEDVIPQGFNARTRAHEYGGGAYVVHAGTLYFSNFKDQRLYAQPAGGGVPVPLTPAPEAPASVRYADGRVTPDGKSIICIRERHEEGREAINEIVAIPADGSGEAQIVVSGDDFYSFPRISPDGRRLAWTCWNHPQMPWDGSELWVGDLAGSAVASSRRVAGSAAESIFQPEWSSDGTLYFISDRTGWWNLYAEQADGIHPIFQTDAEIGIPQWLFGYSRYAFLSNGQVACVYQKNGTDRIAIVDAPTKAVQTLSLPYSVFSSLRSDGDGTLFFAAASSSKAAEVVAYDSREEKPLWVLRRSLEIVIDPGYLSEPETIEFPTAGGLTAFALFYPPKNKDFSAPADERPPLLVISHGGPTSATSSALRLAVQYWTTRGIAVVDVNYGGSTGYGRDYRERLRGQWGIVDVADCINAARYLEERGAVDARRMIIRGGSAGGYTTLCALVFHNVFAAGASYYGVADVTALAKDTHKFESRYGEGLVGPYPEAAELYYQRSPVNFADRLSCPVVLFQGLEDKVVPPSQAEIMIAALRAKRLPFAYVAFPTEGHGFREAASIQCCIESELYFYSRIFGFTTSDTIAPIEIENLQPAPPV